MESNQISNDEVKIYTWMVNETSSELKKHKNKVVLISIGISIVIFSLIMSYWTKSTTVTHTTSLLIGAQLYSFYGALLLAIGAISSPPTLGLMSMTRLNGNPKLFSALMKSRFSARVGIGFVIAGFLMHGIVMITYGS